MSLQRKGMFIIYLITEWVILLYVFKRCSWLGYAGTTVCLRKFDVYLVSKQCLQQNAHSPEDFYNEDSEIIAELWGKNADYIDNILP